MKIYSIKSGSIISFISESGNCFMNLFRQTCMFGLLTKFVALKNKAPMIFLLPTTFTSFMTPALYYSFDGITIIYV